MNVVHSGRLSGVVPALDWLPNYNRSWLKPDVIAALTIWALIVPQSIAYAQIAGLPPQAGLYATFAGLLGYGLLGTSRQLVVSPTSSTAAISAALVAPLAAGESSDYAALVASVAILVGATFIVMAALRLGFVSRFIAASVSTGFLFGLGLTIIAGQLPKVLGIQGADSDNFIPEVRNILQHLGDVSGWTLVLGAGAIAFLFAVARWRPGAPGALIVVAAGIALVALFGLDEHGVAVIGSVDAAFPTPAIPAISSDDLATLIPGALIIAVIGFSEGVTVAESMADEHDYEVKVNQELIGMGGANVLAGLFQGLIVGGGASQSAANDRAGAMSQLVSILAAVLTVVTVIALLPLFTDLPQAALGAIVIVAVWGFLNVPAMRRLARLRRDSFVLAVVAMAAVLLLGVMPGLILSVAMALIDLLVALARPSGSELGRLPGGQALVALENHAEAEAIPGLLLYRPNAPLLFVNAKQLRESVRDRIALRQEPIHGLALDLSLSSGLDVASLNELAALRREMERRGVALVIAGAHTRVVEMLQRGGLQDEIGEANIVRSLDDAPHALELAAARLRDGNASQGRDGGRQGS